MDKQKICGLVKNSVILWLDHRVAGLGTAQERQG